MAGVGSVGLWLAWAAWVGEFVGAVGLQNFGKAEKNDLGGIGGMDP